MLDFYNKMLNIKPKNSAPVINVEEDKGFDIEELFRMEKILSEYVNVYVDENERDRALLKIHKASLMCFNEELLPYTKDQIKEAFLFTLKYYLLTYKNEKNEIAIFDKNKYPVEKINNLIVLFPFLNCFVSLEEYEQKKEYFYSSKDKHEVLKQIFNDHCQYCDEYRAIIDKLINDLGITLIYKMNNVENE